MSAAPELEQHRERLWGLCYRITGIAADADELVQETFVRALESPPEDASRPLLPWLVRVATHASIDALRRRKKLTYVGEWLPAPIPLDLTDETGRPDARYGEAESLSFAFLIALEALTPTQRAILILRDVFGYAARECAEMLSLSEANVKTSLHRAHRALASFERESGASRAKVTPELAREVMLKFFAEVARGNLEASAKLLRSDAISIQDGGGEYLAALRPIASRDHVARFFHGVSRHAVPTSLRLADLNGLAAVIVEHAHHKPRASPRSVHLFEVTASGAISHIYSLIANRKIAHLFGA